MDIKTPITNDDFIAMNTLERIQAIDALHGERAMQLSSMQNTASVLMHLIWRAKARTVILFVDTQYHFQETLDLRDITLFGQDWGGLIGLRLAAEHPDRFARVVAANTGLPTGDRPPGEAFLRWQRYSQESPEFHIGGIVKGGCATDLPSEVIAAYDAPFPDDSYKAGARIFPSLVPTQPDDPAAEPNRRAWEVLQKWEKPFLTAFSDSDPVTKGGERVMQSRIPGAQGQPHTTIVGAGHFLQEDKGEELARIVVDFIAQTS